MRLPRILWLVPFILGAALLAILGSCLLEEARTSEMQAHYISAIASEVRFAMGQGPNAHFTAPADGPYNQRLGYSYLPFFIKALMAEGYEITEQMRASERYYTLLDKGLYALYRPKTVAGLSIEDRSGKPLYTAHYPSRTFDSFAAIPSLLVKTLLFIENRELLNPGPVTRNPAIEWDRFIFAAVGHVVKPFANIGNTGGGSTLATQIEKFRFSPGGQTSNAKDKIVQIASASLRIYQDGPDTRAARERIVLDYLNSTPLSARAGFGEINSIGDGLWAWFGRDIGDVSAALNLPETDADSLRAKASAYRQALSLILAQRRPTAYLLTNRNALDNLIDATLDRLMMQGVISLALRDATRAARLSFLSEAPSSPPPSFLDQKATNALRTHMLDMLDLKNLYELDRVDLNAASTLDQPTQERVVGFLRRMSDPDFVNAIGLYGFRLLKPDNDVSKIKWSVLLYQRGEDGNRLRVQADNIDEPLDMNDGAKLDLGSTAKLRTLVTYLEIIAELYRRYGGLTPEDLHELTPDAPDALTSWALDWLASHPDATLEATLEGAMERTYSASPYEKFFTGGGLHSFVNFEKKEDGWRPDMWVALRDSVNLSFIRLMRDIVNYTIGQGEKTRQELLTDRDRDARRDYLEKFADSEGTVFLQRYIRDYAGLSPDQALEKLAQRGHAGATARAVLYRSIRPHDSFDAFANWVRAHVVKPMGNDRLRKLYADYPITRFNLSDRGYVAGINPMELWLVAYRQGNPGASSRDILAVSRPVRLESYAWLFHPRLKHAQDTRIRIILEQEAFSRIHKRWQRLGYPFDRLVPSLATAIGSSADRPGALAELVGILLNSGVKKPMLRFDTLHFAAGTPYDTLFKPIAHQGERVIEEPIARIVLKAMAGVVEAGTAKRLNGAYVDAAGQPMTVGGKTGTGDHRYDEFGRGGRLISSRVVNRTGTIAFYIGNDFFGTVTAHVAGEQAANYKFTSALSAQMLRSLQPVLQPLINGQDTSQATVTLPVVPKAAEKKEDEQEPSEEAPVETPMETQEWTQ